MLKHWVPEQTVLCCSENDPAGKRRTDEQTQQAQGGIGAASPLGRAWQMGFLRFKEPLNALACFCSGADCWRRLAGSRSRRFTGTRKRPAPCRGVRLTCASAAPRPFRPTPAQFPANGNQSVVLGPGGSQGSRDAA